jgi:1-acyl-sn-glycerol-3-phosphate acyltransferase
MLRGLWACIVLVAATLAFGVPAALVSLFRRGSDATMRLGRFWSRLMLASVGARVGYEGLDRAVSRLPCVYISNHQSNVDIWALIAVLPASTRFVAKQSLFRVPALGWAMAASGFISIDRSNRARAIRSLRAAARRIRDGRPVVLFAEGTRSKSGRLGDFKKGPFHLAVQAGVPVVPVAISGSWQVMPPGSLRVRPGPVTVRFLEPIDVISFQPDNHAGLRDAVRQAIEEGLEPGRRGRRPPTVAGVS